MDFYLKIICLPQVLRGTAIEFCLWIMTLIISEYLYIEKQIYLIVADFFHLKRFQIILLPRYKHYSVQMCSRYICEPLDIFFTDKSLLVFNSLLLFFIIVFSTVTFTKIQEWIKLYTINTLQFSGHVKRSLHATYTASYYTLCVTHNVFTV